MTTLEVLEFFKGYRQTGQALKMWPNSIYTWGKEPPLMRQYQIEVLTKGKLKARRPKAELELAGSDRPRKEKK